MPLNEKGKKIMASMKKQYGKKKGEEVFYAMENSGKLKKVTKARTGYAAEGQYESSRSSTGNGGSSRDPSGRKVSDQGRKALQTQRKATLSAISPSTTRGGQALKYGLMFSGIPFSGRITQGILDRGQRLGYGQVKRKTVNRQNNGNRPGDQKIILPIVANKPIDTDLIKPKDNFFNFKTFNVGGLSGGVKSGPPPRKGPNSQVPPIKMKKGGKL